MEQDAAIIRGAVRKIAINHTDGFEALEALSQFQCWEGAEPAQIDIADFLPLLPQPPCSRAPRGGDLTQTDQDNFGVVSHELCEIGRSVPLSKDRVEFLVGFFDDAARAARSLPILPSKFHHPILVDLRRYGNRVVGMQTTLRQIVRGQKFSDRLFGGNLHDVLGMGQESAIHGDGAGHAHAFIFGDAVGNQDVFQGLLRRRHPQQQPAHIAQRHGIVVFHAKGSRIIQRAVADQKHRRQPV